MKWENYESPINIISTNMRTEFDGEIMKAIQEVRISVDKEELLKCMQYDREQYDKGYEQGKVDAIEEFANWLPKYFDLRFTNNPEVWIDEYFNHTSEKIFEQLKEKQ